MKIGVIFAAGFVAGIAIVVACQNAGRRAGASPADCASWQYATGIPSLRNNMTLTDSSGTPHTYVIDEVTGWEPFAVGLSDVYFRRCKP